LTLAWDSKCWYEQNCTDFECIRKPTESQLSQHTVQTNPAVDRIKTLNGQRVCRISPVGEEKVYDGKNLPKSQVFSSEWKNERVKKDESGDSEDDGAREVRSGVHSKGKVQHTEKSD